MKNIDITKSNRHPLPFYMSVILVLFIFPSYFLSIYIVFVMFSASILTKDMYSFESITILTTTILALNLAILTSIYIILSTINEYIIKKKRQ